MSSIIRLKTLKARFLPQWVFKNNYLEDLKIEKEKKALSELTTVQQRGQNHQSRAKTSSSMRMSNAMAKSVPSDYNRDRHV